MLPAHPRPPALLLGGSENALSAARALRRRSVVVDALGDGLGRSPVRRSNAVRSWRGPQGYGDIQQWWLRCLEDRGEETVLIACCDDAVELIARNRAELEAMGHLVPHGDDAVLLAMLDKAATAEAARRADVLAPAVVSVHDLEQLRDAVGGIGYPCGIKPLASHRFTRATGGFKGATIRNEREMLEVGGRMLDAGLGLLVTEIVPGADPVFCSYNTYIDDDGTALFEITKQKLRQHPIDFGRGTFHRTVKLPEVAELGRRFLRTTGVRGFGNVEFRRDARDGSLKLIECNVRLTAANDLLTRAGCDVASVVYRRAIGEMVDPVAGFDEDVRMWHPARDVRAMLAYRRAGELSVRDWLTDVLPPPHLPLLSVTDPMPSIDTAVAKAFRLPGKTRLALGS